MSDLNAIEVFAHKNVKPSIDKMTIVGHSSMDILNDDIFELAAKYGQNRYLVKETTSDRFMGYKRFWEISYRQYFSGGSFEIYTLALFIGLNGHSACMTYKEQRKFKIEFNPNKFEVPDWLIMYFAQKNYIAEEIKNIDIAFDFVGFPKRDFRYVLNSANTKTMSIGTQNNRTDYIACSDKSANRIKIYDKKKERKKFYHMDMETTRVEITLEYRHYGNSYQLFDDDYKYLIKASKAIEQIFIADDTARDPYVYALSCLDTDQLNTAFSLMSINTRTKYKKLLKEQSGFKLFCNTLMLSEFLYDGFKKIMSKIGIPFEHDVKWSDINDFMRSQRFLPQN